MTDPVPAAARAPAAAQAPAAARAPALSRSTARTTPAAPVRIVHLGLGNFFRAHQAWYTAAAPGGDRWGIAAFTGRSGRLSQALTAQDGLYTLLTRSAASDTAAIITSISRAHAGPDTAALVGYLTDPGVAVVSLTVTEAGYVCDARGCLNMTDPALVADIIVVRDWLSRTRPVPPPALRTTPARLVVGLAARRGTGAGSIAVVPCDNLPDNGKIAAAVVGDCAAAVNSDLAAWIADQVSFVSTVVDRITPASDRDDTDAAAATALTGLTDQVPVVTEPFTEWVLSGSFPAGRPAWEATGARFVEDVTPYEQRKLWLLNGGHTLLAYLGSARGHATVAEAMADEFCRAWLSRWWDLASRHLDLPPADTADYTANLVARFTNPRIRHLLAQIATDGSQKIPVRILPVLRRERDAGRLPAPAVHVVAGWIDHLRGAGVTVNDVAAARLAALAAGPITTAVPRVLGFLDPALAADSDLVTAITAAGSAPRGGCPGSPGFHSG